MSMAPPPIHGWHGNVVGSLRGVASSTEEVLFYYGATVIVDVSAGVPYDIAMGGESDGGDPVVGENFGGTVFTVRTSPETMFAEIEQLMPAGSEWEYLLVAEDDPDDVENDRWPSASHSSR